MRKSALFTHSKCVEDCGTVWDTAWDGAHGGSSRRFALQLAVNTQLTPGPKNCGACGADVAARPDRVKYAEGDYRCRPCHTERRQREARKAQLAKAKRALGTAAGVVLVLATTTFVLWAYLGS